MTHVMQPSWGWWLLRPSWRHLAVLAALAALVATGWVYLSYFTPEKRAARHHLAEADAKSQAAIDTRLKSLSDLFAKGRKGAKPFAEEALSWNGKWQFIKGIADGGESHRQYLAEAFARLVFSSDELREALEGAVAAYLNDIDGFEAEMLVRLRADLADPSRSGEALPAHLRGDAEFRREYRKLVERMGAELGTDLGVTVGRELGIAIASDVATRAALQAVKAMAAEMGVSAGLLSTGAVSTVATFGVGMVIALILDYVLDEVFKLVGYDPAAKIEALVIESIDKMEAALIHEGGLLSVHKKGALRERMEELHEGRSKLRRETINRLLKEGGK